MTTFDADPIRTRNQWCTDRQDAMKRALVLLRAHMAEDFEGSSVFEQVIEDGVPFNCENAPRS